MNYVKILPSNPVSGPYPTVIGGFVAGQRQRRTSISTGTVDSNGMSHGGVVLVPGPPFGQHRDGGNVFGKGTSIFDIPCYLPLSILRSWFIKCFKVSFPKMELQPKLTQPTCKSYQLPFLPPSCLFETEGLQPKQCLSKILMTSWNGMWIYTLSETNIAPESGWLEAILFFSGSWQL